MIFRLELKRGGVVETAGTVSVQRLCPGNDRSCFGVDFFLRPEAADSFTEEAEIQIENQFIRIYKANERI